MLPPLPSTSAENLSKCRYHCGHECAKALILTHQRACVGNPRYELDHMASVKYTYTCNHCRHRLFDMLKHFRYGTCLPDLPALPKNKRKREWPITVVKMCHHCSTIFSTKYNADRHFSRMLACQERKNEIITENDSDELYEQFQIDEINNIDPMAVQSPLPTPSLPRSRSNGKSCTAGSNKW